MRKRELILLLILLLSITGQAKAADTPVMTGKMGHFLGFCPDNTLEIKERNVLFWQIGPEKMSASQRDVQYTIIRDGNGRLYWNVDGIGKTEVKALKLIGTVRAKNSAKVQKGQIVELSGAVSGKWQITTEPSEKNKEIAKDSRLLVGYDVENNLTRLFPEEDTWSVVMQQLK